MEISPREIQLEIQLAVQTALSPIREQLVEVRTEADYREKALEERANLAEASVKTLMEQGSAEAKVLVEQGAAAARTSALKMAGGGGVSVVALLEVIKQMSGA